jgi:hypothetical protein
VTILRAPLAFLVAGLIALAVTAVAQGQGGAPVEDFEELENPCLGPDAAELLCPNLRMRPPSDLFVSRTRSGRRLLHAKNSIDSRGEGPAELRGARARGKHYMEANQRVLLRDGGRRTIRTPAYLGFKHIPGQGGYWKYKDAALFEIWTLDEDDNPVERVRTGPKVYYCLRDLVRTRAMAGSPHRRVYPACNQNRDITRVTLGTSVGWSDIYPATYHEQYIEVTGLRGRYGFFHIADPNNGIWENDEDDNAAMTIGSRPSGKPGGARGPMPRPQGGGPEGTEAGRAG